MKTKRIKITIEKGTPIPQKDITESNARIAKEMKKFIKNMNRLNKTL